VNVRAAAGVLAAAEADHVGVAFVLVVADDEQPARRAIKVTNAARTGVSPIPRARRRARAGSASLLMHRAL
jgi:hypothetical protein